MSSLVRTTALLGIALPFPALAQTPAQVPGEVSAATTTNQVTSYDAAYFATYAPSSALDIAQRVPGFQLESGDDDDEEEVRGFAGAAGNVVINGARPSTKSESLATLLRRIPAKRVVRVEMQPGSAFGSDYSGKSQVLNIILSGDGGLDGTLTSQFIRRYPDKWLVAPSATALWKKGNWSANIAAGYTVRDSQEEGYDLVSTIGGEPIEHRLKVNDMRDREPNLSVTIANEQSANKSARVNLRYERNPFTLIQDNLVTPTVGTAHRDGLIFDYFNKVFEVGGDVTRPLAGGAIKLVGLATRRDRDNFDAYYGNNPGGDLVGGFEQRTIADRDETLGRLSWSRSNLGGFSVDTGAEYVVNTLDNRTRLSLIEEDGGRTPVDLPIANATVKEKRGLIFANVGKALSPTVRVDVNLAYERSKLTVGGDTSAARSLSFFKPGLTVDWRPKGGWHAQASLKREVAQLNFYDFVSSAELANDRVNGGNANLLPQRSWEARLLIEKPILGDGLAKLELGADYISLLQDRILTDDGFDAPGNIGDGRRRFIAATLDAPLAFAGLKGARIKLFAQRQHTSVEDPLTNSDRPFSGFWPKWRYEAEYRHDLGKFAYGFGLFGRSHFCFYRIDELDCNDNDRLFGTAFAEYRPDGRTTVTFDVDNLLSTHGVRDRRFHVPNRSGPPAFIEFRDRNEHRAYSITVKRQLG